MAARKLMLKNLSGDSSWRYGKPEKATVGNVTLHPISAPAGTMEDIPETADTPETPVAETPADNAAAELSGAHTEIPAEDSPAAESEDGSDD
jgi:hypothetical protein